MGQGQPTVEDNNANFATPSVFVATRRDIYRENVEGDQKFENPTKRRYTKLGDNYPNTNEESQNKKIPI